MTTKALLFLLILFVTVSYFAVSFLFVSLFQTRTQTELQKDLQTNSQGYKQEARSGSSETASFLAEGFGAKRARILSELRLAIDEAVKEGRYKCCIEPACTMCYLGNWIWDDGTCDCDTMIKEGKWDKVCPECKRGIEEGYCKSSLANKCEERTEN